LVESQRVNERSMRTVTIEINDIEYSKLGLNAGPVTFNDLKEKISIEYAKEALIKCNQIARETGLAALTLEEINAEIKALRNEKNRP
jgi:hypothetical protein